MSEQPILLTNAPRTPKARWENRPEPMPREASRAPRTVTIAIAIAAAVAMLFLAAKFSGDNAVALVKPSHAADNETARPVFDGDGPSGYFPDLFQNQATEPEPRPATF